MVCLIALIASKISASSLVNGHMTDVSAPHRILDRYDALLVDLDGTVFRGGVAVGGALEGLAGRAICYVTNNASRSPAEVAAHLSSLGFTAVAQDVVTSAQAACVLAVELAERSSFGSDVETPTALVIGAESFRDLARAAGFRLVNSAEEHPTVVFHGHSPHNNWAILSEAALAVRAGAIYIASNLDTTLPSERGLLVGNGSMVAAVVSASGVVPHSAGKPEPTMFHTAALRHGATHPLAIGDRLDTDIAGGIAASMDTLCVLTGVATHQEVLHTNYRPTWIAANLNDHLEGWSAAYEDGKVVVSSGEVQCGPNATTLENMEVMAAEALAVAAPLVWVSDDRHEDVAVVPAPGDSAAAVALEAWR